MFTTVVWAHSVLSGFAHERMSGGGDANSFEFYLGWNLHAVVNFMNPFFTPAMYAPAGLDLGNAISVPAVALLVSPVTVTFGTTAAFNVAILLSVFAASAAVYLLARELFGSILGATLAGALTAVSPYLVGHGVGHLNMMWVAGMPFVVFLAARHVRRRLRTRWLVIWTAATVAFSIGSSTELFVTQSGFAVVAAAVAIVVVPDRKRLSRTLLGSAGGGVLGILLGMPVIIAAARSGIPDAVANPPSLYSTDLTNIFFPTQLVIVGDSWPEALRSTWFGNVAENTAYIPVTLLLLMILALATLRDRATRSLLVYAALAILASLGPILTVAGQRTINLPWKVTEHVPGLDHALPGRFSAFAFFALALVVASLWASRGIPRWLTATLVAASLALLVPSTARMNYPFNTEPPPYIADGTWKHDIDRGDVVLTLPSGQNGNGMLWQTRTDFAFKTPTGNGGGAIAPPDLLRPVGRALYLNGTADIDWRAELPTYLSERGVRTILIEDTDAGDQWRRVINKVYPGRGRLEGGVWVYVVPPV